MTYHQVTHHAANFLLGLPLPGYISGNILAHYGLLEEMCATLL